jgi:acetolactate synthase-1/2/3 large subunit
MLREAKRPVMWLGHGIRLAGSVQLLEAFLEHYSIPTILSWAGADMVEHPMIFGRAGVYGQRCANKIIAEADVILAIGTRLSLLQTGYDISKIRAKLIVVDIDPQEASKHNPEKTVVGDAGDFILECLAGEPIKSPKEWWNQCCGWHAKYPWVESPTHDDTSYINSYRFMERLGRHLKPDQIIVTDVGAGLLCAHQALKLRPPQRLITSTGLGEMGFGLPAAIGASFARNKGEVLCLNTDGGMMFNLQELQTVRHHNLPIKIIVFSNDGYQMIRASQKNLGMAYVGSNEASGVSCPDFVEVSRAFGIASNSIRTRKDFDSVMPVVMGSDRPVLIEVFIDPDQPYLPKLATIIRDSKFVSPEFADMSPCVDIS